MNTENYLFLARTAAKGRSHSEAHKYWSLVLEEDPRNVEAWIGKGTAAGWLSDFFGEGVKEAKSSLEQAVELGLADEHFKREAAASAYRLAEIYFDRANSLYLRLQAQGTDSVQQRMALGIETQLTGSELLRLAWRIEKSTDRANSLTKICDSHRKRFGRDAGDFVDDINRECRSWVQNNDPSAIARLAPVAPKPSGCFIATASYRSCAHPRVPLLQEFRDSWLLKRKSGRILTKIYYRISPPLARLIERSPSLQSLSRVLLSCPVYIISKWLMKRTVSKARR